METLTISETIQQVTGDMAADIPVMLWGPPGVGKSDAVRQAAAGIDPDAPVIDIRLSQLEPSDLRGIPYPDPDGRRTVNLLPDWLPTQPVEFGVLFFDEVTSAMPTVAAACYQLILDRKQGTYTVPDGWVMVAAGNRLSDRGVVNPMPSPLANRFVHYECAADAACWLHWAADNDIDPRIRAYIAAVNDSLFNLDVSQGDIRAYASPRSWAFLSRRLSVSGGGVNMLRTACAYVGESAGADFVNVLPVLDQLPSLQEILDNPHGCRVPDTSGGNVSALAACFGIANMCAAAVVKDTGVLDTVYPYLERLPLREVIPAMMADVLRQVDKAQLIGSEAYRKFALEFADMLL